ncbi:hypothetical protein PRZ48_008174 [Zasmidium cellare]|uniref:PrsW family intramembrane metalloprotease n=1 Tax=Zasmidium cellare TaxID=395010 RepID=A0ABR0EFZ6_ZASCE|nr:hypothetical protein PRZ48_008174 [Zasmidium cellare]
MTNVSATTTILSWNLPPTILVLLGLASPLTMLLSAPVLAISIAFLRYCYLRDPTNAAHFETLFYTLLATGTIGVAGVSTIQGTLLKPIANLLFGSQATEYFTEFTRSNINDLSDVDKKRRKQMAWSWRYIAFLFLFTFGLAALSEEVLKYSGIVTARRFGSVETGREYLQTAIAATLGFSTVENIAFLYAGRHDSAAMLALTTVERIVLGMPGHALSGCLLALGVMRGGEVGWVQLFFSPVVYHGLWDFSLFSISAANGNVGWVHPKDVGSGMAVLGVAVRSEMGSLGVVW